MLVKKWESFRVFVLSSVLLRRKKVRVEDSAFHYLFVLSLSYFIPQFFFFPDRLLAEAN